MAPMALLLLAACIPQSGGAYQDTGYRPAPQQSPRQDRYPQAPQERWERPALGNEQDVRRLPAPPPAWQSRKVSADARSIAGRTYVVQPGDSLRSISAKTGAGSEAIARANDIPPPFVIRVGQKLTIPGGRYHLVRDGETGIAIAVAYGVTWSRIIAVNELEEPYILRTGQRLLIPDDAAPSGRPETIEQRAARFHLDLGVDDIVTGGQPAIAEKAKPAQPTASSARVLSPTTPVAAPARLAGGFQWPLKGNVVKRFGPGASGERNDGIKIAAPLDTPVLASADGVVAYVGSDIPALGGLVILRHGDGWTTVYGHAGQLLVQRGQAVKKGQMIALSGNSGFADRPELHFEIRQGRNPVDPLPRLPAR
ncbi:M23 family metallopeptidase [Sphingomonas sp. HITSZ_GF]|uniref:M23 family metallopeptidase n=1 Tax=Sphingomonas sp. HITSZ_GF TaxID=3037247 RepID=UPI00240D63FC|nr:M23 family metallopeptidase [Sphingomonas sp. HITSZ_GF]MDG2532522.1 M23 family metallopeptidase [Sphingomonas sp. HITSZ_GF]